MPTKYQIFLTIVIVQHCYGHFKTYEDTINSSFDRKVNNENKVTLFFSDAWKTAVVKCDDYLKKAIQNYSMYSLQHTVDFNKDLKTNHYYETEPKKTSLPTLLLLLRTDEN